MHIIHISRLNSLANLLIIILLLVESVLCLLRQTPFTFSIHHDSGTKHVYHLFDVILVRHDIKPVNERIKNRPVVAQVNSIFSSLQWIRKQHDGGLLTSLYTFRQSADDIFFYLYTWNFKGIEISIRCQLTTLRGCCHHNKVHNTIVLTASQFYASCRILIQSLM